MCAIPYQIDFLDSIGDFCPCVELEAFDVVPQLLIIDVHNTHFI